MTHVSPELASAHERPRASRCHLFFTTAIDLFEAFWWVRFAGFFLYAKILERVTAGIQSGAINAPKSVGDYQLSAP
jgi:hypothetical protein